MFWLHYTVYKKVTKLTYNFQLYINFYLYLMEECWFYSDIANTLGMNHLRVKYTYKNGRSICSDYLDIQKSTGHDFTIQWAHTMTVIFTNDMVQGDAFIMSLSMAVLLPWKSVSYGTACDSCWAQGHDKKNPVLINSHFVSSV